MHVCMYVCMYVCTLQHEELGRGGGGGMYVYVSMLVCIYVCRQEGKHARTYVNTM